MTDDADHTDADVLHVKVVFTRADGTTIELKGPVEMALQPMAESIEATARQIWLEAGSPKHAFITVEERKIVGEFVVEDGEVRKFDR